MARIKILLGHEKFYNKFLFDCPYLNQINVNKKLYFKIQYFTFISVITLARTYGRPDILPDFWHAIDYGFAITASL